MNNLTHLLELGQSYWLDNLSRKKITGGELRLRIKDDGLRGITSNPSIFNKAISNSKDYDKQIRELVKNGKTPVEIYEALTVRDVQDACDLLYPVYKKSNGIDGFVSLEVSPYLARDTKGSMREARRLSEWVNRPNCYIKIPGTKEGLPAIEQMIYEGIPINITLLFSVERYREIAQCYIRALQRRVAKGLAVNNLVSVASFFLSRIDVLTDSLLSQKIITSQKNKGHTGAASLLGKAGIASARLAYQQFKEFFGSETWKELEKQHANVQRLLWASTSTKDPLYGDLMYVESLVGKDTVNTLPDETIDALQDHGVLKENTIEENSAEAINLFAELENFGIDIKMVTQQLENEGIDKFKEAYNELISNIAKKRIQFLGHSYSNQDIFPGDLKKEMDAVYKSLDEKKTGHRLFNEDPYLWAKDPGEINIIRNRLGWLRLPTNTERYKSFTRKIKNEGYQYAVLLGMGGSSLCSEVAAKTFPHKKGYLKLLVLDNTSPAAILDLEKQIVPEKTIFIVASKSGSTLETISFFRYFFDRIRKKTKNAGDQFVAITDAGTPLVKLAEKYHFRKIFINPSDIGGRYSVLSDFGLLPMALMGIDIDAMLNNAILMQKNCSPEIPSANNPALSLGAFLGMARKSGRDKLTFILSPSIQTFGSWVEQLLAESTGKQGRGLIPVTGEEIGAPVDYGKDRIFVHLSLQSDKHAAQERKVSALEKAGHPLIHITLPNKLALGGEYYRWEIATAIAGKIMNIDPFNEPNVAEGKKNTNELLNEWIKDHKFKKPAAILREENLTVYAGKHFGKLVEKKKTGFQNVLKKFMGLVKPGDYLALLCYFEETGKRTKILQDCRRNIRNDRKIATTFAYGPRYLHSTGQLHKGGPANGIYIILAAKEEKNLRIPGKDYSFDTLHEAQSWGDFYSLDTKGRRILYIQLGNDTDAALQYLQRILNKHSKK